MSSYRKCFIKDGPAATGCVMREYAPGNFEFCVLQYAYGDEATVWSCSSDIMDISWSLCRSSTATR